LKIALMQTCECQKTEQPALEIELLAGAAQASLPDGDRFSNLRRRQHGTVAASSESMRCRSRLSDDARLVRHRLAHAALSNPSEKVPQPIEKPCKQPSQRGTDEPRTDGPTRVEVGGVRSAPADRQNEVSMETSQRARKDCSGAAAWEPGASAVR
jgi:hypothetical protein